MFDDLEVNLTLPQERGMTTVLVTGADETPYQQVAARQWRVSDLPVFLDLVAAQQ